MKADPDRDEIAIDGVPLPDPSAPMYLMLNKPRGYVTTLSDEKGRPTAANLVAGCGVRVWPVGRLDLNSEGLLLFTNDGELTQMLLHPSHEIEKEYLVRVDGWTDGSLERLQGQFVLDGQRLAPARVDLRNVEGQCALFRITIHEGKNRQIRRMCEIAGLRVLRLKRIREGKLSLGELKPGQWRALKREDII